MRQRALRRVTPDHLFFMAAVFVGGVTLLSRWDAALALGFFVLAYVALTATYEIQGTMREWASSETYDTTHPRAGLRTATSAR